MPDTDTPHRSSERATFIRAPLFAAAAHIDLLRAFYFTHRFSPHAHDEFAIGLIEFGAVRTCVRDRIIVARAGDIIALNPGDVHTGEPVDAAGYGYRMFYVGETMLRPARAYGANRGPGNGLSVAFVDPLVRDPALAMRLARAHQLLETSSGSFAAECALIEALSELAHRHGVTPPVIGARPTHPIVRVVRDYLEAQYGRVVTLAELSSLTGVSPFYLSRVFRVAMGVPPYAYLALVRVRRARELIARGLPLSLVTHEAGFSDQSHFTRQFKRVVGIPPGQYANAIRRARATQATRDGMWSVLAMRDLRTRSREPRIEAVASSS